MVSRLAVLVDGDNISGMYAGQIRRIAEETGKPDILRVYLNARNDSEWHRADGFRLVHAGTGKNASDLLLAIQAMELAMGQGVEAFVIASSDGDFSHLAHHLRERGLPVIGVGEEKAPGGFRAACSEFVQVGATPVVRLAAAPRSKVAPLDQKIRAMIQQHSTDGTGMKIAVCGALMHSQHAVSAGTLQEGNWRAYFVARPHLYDLDPRGPDARVRFRPDGFKTAVA